MACKNGHNSERLKNGKCAECSREQCRRYYAQNRQAIIGQKRAYQAENADAVAERRAAYREKNKLALRAKCREYHRDHAEARREATRAWRASLTPEQRKEHDQKTHQKYRVRRLAQHREWMQRTGYQWHRVNPEAQAAKNARRRTKSRQAEGSYTADDVKALVARQKSRCACCGAKKKLAVDHIVPLAKGGSNWPRNLQMLCRSCNSKKAARDPVEFMQSMGALL